MKNSNTNLAPIQEVWELKENKIQLPTIEEIREKGLSPELINQLKDSNSRFENDLVVFPVWSEEWEDLQVSCMATGCGSTYVSYWKHSNCNYSYPSRIQWSTHANLKCPSCGTVSDISRWSFKCHGNTHDYTSTDLTTLTDVVSMLLEYPGANRQFASKFLKSAKEVFNR